MHALFRSATNLNALPHRFTYLLTVALALLLLSACNRNRNEPTPTPTPPPAVGQSGVVDATTAQPVTTIEPAAQAPAEAPPDATAAPTPAPLSGRVVLWHSWAQAEGDALAAVLAQLQEAHPGIQVDTLFVAPNDLVASYAEAVAAGTGPDLVLAPNWWLGDLVAANAVLNLEPFLGGSLETSYTSAAVEAMRHEGALYGLPLSFNLVAMYVNNSLLPPQGIPTNTADLLETARISPTAGVGLYATLFHTYWGLPAYGAQLLNEQGVATLDQSDSAAQFLTWLNALNSTPGSYVNSDYGMLLDRFKKGEFAYLVDGPWALPELRTVLGDSLSVWPIPDGPNGPTRPWLYSDGIFVNPTITPEQRTVALTAALFLTGDQAGTTLATIGGLLPAARDADLSSTPLLQGFRLQATTAVPMPTTSEMNEVWTYGGDMIIKALTGVADPPTIVAETTTLINEANGK